jgi:hypothetical protein
MASTQARDATSDRRCRCAPSLTLQYSEILIIESSSVVSRPVRGDAPTIDLVVGYSKANTSPLLKLFLARLDELIARVSKKVHRDL